jgi:hypothetical protein
LAAAEAIASAELPCAWAVKAAQASAQKAVKVWVDGFKWGSCKVGAAADGRPPQ